MVESRKRRPRSSDRVRATLSVLLLGSTGCLPSRSLAQAGCGVAWTTPFRVDNATAVSILRAAANCTNGGSLVAEWADYAVTVDAPIVIASGTFLSVTGENASAEVHGGLETRLFEVAPGGELTLTQLKMSEGAAENGGAIYSDFATLSLDGCTFDGNVATDGDGGAVWADKGTVTIVCGDFVGNTATRYGGAVLATDARLVIRGSRFESNEASIGGALFCGGVAELSNTATEPSCSITDSEFTSNIANDGSQSEVNPYTEHDGGGAAAFLRTNVSVVDSNFSRNSALRSGGALNGGNATDIKLDGCTFGKNTADRHGGAIVASSLTLGESTRLANNEASSSGGAVSATAVIYCLQLKCNQMSVFPSITQQFISYRC